VVPVAPSAPRSTSAVEQRLRALEEEVQTLRSLKRKLFPTEDQPPASPAKKARVLTYADLCKDESDAGKFTQYLYLALIEIPVPMAFGTQNFFGLGEIGTNYAAFTKNKDMVKSTMDAITVPSMPTSVAVAIGLALHGAFESSMLIAIKVPPAELKFIWLYIQRFHLEDPPLQLLRLGYYALHSVEPIFISTRDPAMQERCKADLLAHLLTGTAPLDWRAYYPTFPAFSGLFIHPEVRALDRKALIHTLEQFWGPLRAE